MVLAAAKRARDLVKSLMAFCRQTEDEGMPVPLAPTVKEFVRMLRPTIPSTIEIVSTVHDVGYIHAGQTDFQQILMNLCTNAYHAMRGTAGQLTIGLDTARLPDAALETAKTLAAGDYARLVVKDTGKGMDAQVQDRIFDPFFTTKPQGEGTGLGLSIVYGIVQRLKGSISIQSAAGKGSCFTIYLPQQEREAEPACLEAPVSGGKERILVVDDEHHISEVLGGMLRLLGYEAVAVYSAAQALQLLAESDFDLLITDQTMPGMTGIELIRRVVAEKGLKSILTSGYSEQIEESQALAAGAAGFMQKPFGRATLAKMVRHVLGETTEVCQERYV
jgi:CheY-like chemotaxis protein/anti-sigma regulatory factor (Ser/Thr protein kinase)